MVTSLRLFYWTDESWVVFYVGVEAATDRSGKEVGEVRRGELGVSEEDSNVVGDRRRDVHPEAGDGGAELRHDEGRPGGSRDGDVRSSGRALREDRNPAEGRWSAGGELQHIQPDAVALRHDHQPLQVERKHSELQFGRNGVQRQRDRHRSGSGHAGVESEQLRRRGEHGDGGV